MKISTAAPLVLLVAACRAQVRGGGAGRAGRGLAARVCDCAALCPLGFEKANTCQCWKDKAGDIIDYTCWCEYTEFADCQKICDNPPTPLCIAGYTLAKKGNKCQFFDCT
jgi:hypothetical protein